MSGKFFSDSILFQDLSCVNKYRERGYLLSSIEQKDLEDNLQMSLRPEYQLRILIMLLADSGLSQAQICKELHCAQETARFWIYIAKSGQAESWKSIPLGRPKIIGENHLARLRELVTRSPRECGYPFQKWTAKWLNTHLRKEYNVQVSDRHINRLLKQMGFSTKKLES